MAFNLGDKVRVVDTQNTHYEAGFVGEVIEVGPLDNGEDYMVRITDRSGAKSEEDPKHEVVNLLMELILGDELSYPEDALELV